MSGTSSTSNAKTKAKKKSVAKGRKFNGNWNEIPSSRQLLALVIRSIESGERMVLPTTREEATAALGYSNAS